MLFSIKKQTFARGKNVGSSKKNINFPCIQIPEQIPKLHDSENIIKLYNFRWLELMFINIENRKIYDIPATHSY